MWFQLATVKRGDALRAPPEVPNPDGASQRARVYWRCAPIVIDIGRLEQVPVTPGLVHVMAFPPALPETANMPVQVAETEAMNVNVPVNADAVVLPVTRPLTTMSAVAVHMPDTEFPSCVSVIESGAFTRTPLRLQSYATARHPTPSATLACRRRQRHRQEP